MLINATAVRFVVGPVAIVYIAVDVDKTAFSMSTIFPPFTAVLGSIIPSLLTKAITETTFPLARVNGTSLESVWRACLSLLIRVVSVFSYGFSSLLLRKVFAAS